MFTFIITLSLVIAALLIVVILLQSSKGTGLAGSAFGGGSAVLGVRRTADFLSNTTTVLAFILAILCIASNYVIPREGVESTESFIDKAQQKNPPASAPAVPTE